MKLSQERLRSVDLLQRSGLAESEVHVVVMTYFTVESDNLQYPRSCLNEVTRYHVSIITEDDR